MSLIPANQAFTSWWTSQDKLLDLEVTQDKVVMRRFMKELVSDKGLAAYGEAEVRRNLELGACRHLCSLRTCERPGAKIECTNRSCDFSQEQTRTSASEPPGSCLKCGSALAVAEGGHSIQPLQLADKSGAAVKIISTEFEEGAQLFKAFGGIAAILRYKTSRI